MNKNKHTFRSIETTNSEWALVGQLVDFCKWISEENIIIPPNMDSGKGEELLVKYLLKNRIRARALVTGGTKKISDQEPTKKKYCFCPIDDWRDVPLTDVCRVCGGIFPSAEK